MGHPYQLTLTIQNTSENLKLAGEFNEDDWNCLAEFVQYAEELLNTKYVQDGMSASLNLKWDKDSGMAVSTKLPDWNDVTVFLHKFRPIGLQSENTYFYRVCSILAKELAHPYFRNMIHDQREIYSGRRMQSIFRIQADNVILNSEKVLNDWLNGFEYHRDKKKREFIESLNQILPLEASKVLFLDLLVNKVQAINNIAELSRVVIGKQKSGEVLIKLSDKNPPNSSFT